MKPTLAEAVSLFSVLGSLEDPLEKAGDLACRTLRNGGKILICGNGGSACQAQHLAGELLGRYKQNRRPLAAVPLTADGATLTCIGNDFQFEDVFSRQIEALARQGDLLVVFTTSGQSPNIVAALRSARHLGVASIAFHGRDGGPACKLADVAIIVPHQQTNRIQEAHQFLLHCLMDQIEAELT
jgi:D-sedoheptulose 7-phosphate isomerase